MVVDDLVFQLVLLGDVFPVLFGQLGPRFLDLVQGQVLLLGLGHVGLDLGLDFVIGSDEPRTDPLWRLAHLDQPVSAVGRHGG